MKSSSLTKALFFISVVVILLLVYNTINTITDSHHVFQKSFELFSETHVNSDLKVQEEVNNKLDGDKTDMKYILQWTSPNNVPFVYMGIGQQGFIDRKCPYTNCFVTADRNYLNDITKFDVIAFAGPEVVRSNNLPNKRVVQQKYAFASIESSDNYPICSNRFDGYFNWTWTYALDSQVRWGYFNIRDKTGAIVGPNKEMNWIKLEDMDPVTQNFKEELKNKSVAAAWFVSNCNTRRRREDFAKKLKIELKKYNLVVDIYGTCGSMKCSRDNEEACYKLIKEKYYFYLSFENSFSEDYVTEKLLNALNNNAVPVVYGGANYTRFMPDGIYLNALELGVEKLAAKMSDLINNTDKYAEYFRWKNHYTYHRKHESVDTDEYCLFCTTLNDEQMVKSTSIYKHFREWWDPPDRC